eukprot:gene40444-54697_t
MIKAGSPIDSGSQGSTSPVHAAAAFAASPLRLARSHS